jgi:hypothetical protein
MDAQLLVHRRYECNHYPAERYSQGVGNIKTSNDLGGIHAGPMLAVSGLRAKGRAGMCHSLVQAGYANSRDADPVCVAWRLCPINGFYVSVSS